MKKFQQSTTAAAANGEPEGFYLDAHDLDDPAVAGSGQRSRYVNLQMSQRWHLRGNLEIGQLQQVELWPSTIQVTNVLRLIRQINGKIAADPRITFQQFPQLIILEAGNERKTGSTTQITTNRLEASAPVLYTQG